MVNLIVCGEFRLADESGEGEGAVKNSLSLGTSRKLKKKKNNNKGWWLLYTLMSQKILDTLACSINFLVKSLVFWELTAGSTRRIDGVFSLGL